MLKITGLSDKPCFLTGSHEDVMSVKFADGSFTGSLSWSALLDVLKRKVAEAEKDKNKEKRQTEQTRTTSPPKPEKSMS